jgi:tetraacyldisaccharide 4'-kinase
MKTPEFWKSTHSISTALLPLSMLYRLGAWLDRKCSTGQGAPVPVIGVGNVTAGGAGKTPTTLALVSHLRALGYTPHIVVRGYGGRALHAHRVAEHDTWQLVGDEALLLAQAAPTWVGRDRRASIAAAATHGATIVICDDALQHHALACDIMLLVIDGAYGIGNGRLLPAGPLREPLPNAIARADALVMIGDDTQAITATLTLPIIHARITPTMDTATLQGLRVLAFAGIGKTHCNNS